MGEFTDFVARKAKGSQGKTSEKDVQKYLQAKANGDKHFDWHRAYDARSAGGKAQRITGDFSYYRPGEHGVIEVKETAFDSRLPYGNYELHQVAKVAVRKLAGGRSIVLVYCTSSLLWRRFDISFFQHRDTTKGVGSWFWPENTSTYGSADIILDDFFDGHYV